MLDEARFRVLGMDMEQLGHGGITRRSLQTVA